MKRLLLVLVLLTGCGSANQPFNFKDAKFGVFMHFKAPQGATIDSWNEQVDGFDVKGLADQLEAIGAGYFFITIGHGDTKIESGVYKTFYAAPNSSLNESLPGRTSNRDLIHDIAIELRERGIPLFVYMPYGASPTDQDAIKAFRWGINDTEFQSKWNSVIEEYSKRWGDLVSGWWFDELWRSQDANFDLDSIAPAAKAGNANSIVALDPGNQCEAIIMANEDYTAGENFIPDCAFHGGLPPAKQYQVLSFLGSEWFTGKPRFSTQEIVDFTIRVNNQGGAMTWDSEPEPNGTLKPEFFEQLRAIKSACDFSSCR